MCGLSFIFCRSIFIGNFIVKNKSLKLKYLQNHLFKKNFRTLFWRSNLHKQAGRIFFSKFFFQRLGPFFSRLQNHWFGAHFFAQKKFSSFFQMWLFIFIIILNTWFKILFRRTVRNCWFYSFKHSNPTSYFKVYSNSLSC